MLFARGRLLLVFDQHLGFIVGYDHHGITQLRSLAFLESGLLRSDATIFQRNLLESRNSSGPYRYAGPENICQVRQISWQHSHSFFKNIREIDILGCKSPKRNDMNHCCKQLYQERKVAHLVMAKLQTRPVFRSDNKPTLYTKIVNSFSRNNLVVKCREWTKFRFACIWSFFYVFLIENVKAEWCNPSYKTMDSRIPIRDPNVSLRLSHISWNSKQSKS